MLNLKKTAIAVLALGSSAVFAGSMGPVCSAVNVTVPCEATAWDFGAKALYLKASATNDVGYNQINDLGFNSSTAHSNNGHSDAAYNWGFQIEGSYHFNTGNDLNINWYHLSHSSSDTHGAQPAFVFKTGATTSTSITEKGAEISINPKWDAVNFEFGQHVDFGDSKAIRFHGGAQYARLANSVTASSGVLTSIIDDGEVGPGVSSTVATTYNPTYNGFGPRLGMDMSYDWGNGLGIYANGATAILAGTRSFQATWSDNLGNSIGGSRSGTVIVPAIDAKLGATYTYAMAQGDLTLDAGWMWVNYFNVHANMNGDNNDFGLQGPFIGLKWMGNVA